MLKSPSSGSRPSRFVGEQKPLGGVEQGITAPQLAVGVSARLVAPLEAVVKEIPRHTLDFHAEGYEGPYLLVPHGTSPAYYVQGGEEEPDLGESLCGVKSLLLRIAIISVVPAGAQLSPSALVP